LNNILLECIALFAPFLRRNTFDAHITLILSTIIYSLCRGVIYKNVGILLGGCLTKKN